MSKQRPHFQDSIAQLEQLVEQQRSDRQRLEIIAAELDRRDRAVLAGKVRRFAEKCRAVSENESR